MPKTVQQYIHRGVIVDMNPRATLTEKIHSNHGCQHSQQQILQKGRVFLLQLGATVYTYVSK